MKITIYLNDSEDHFFGYEPGHIVEQAFTYEIDRPAPPGVPIDAYATEHAYHVCNVDIEMAGPDDRPIVERYRKARNRSLSPGDVVRVDNTWFAVSRAGFTRLTAPPTVKEYDYRVWAVLHDRVWLPVSTPFARHGDAVKWAANLNTTEYRIDKEDRE